MTAARLPALAAAVACGLAATPVLAGGQVVSAAPAIAAVPATLQVSVAGVDAAGLLDSQYSGYGRNISPPLSWSGAPPRTRAYAVVVEDPDAAPPQPVVHWLAWNIPAAQHDLGRALRNLPELQSPAGVRQGRNSHGGLGWTGPHPPVGDPPHHYHVQVFALDRPLGLGGGADRDAVARALAGRVLARGEAVVRYAEAPPRPPRA